ncbi:lipid-transfer protein [Jatrophihabitans sp.]|uniref:thiolase C-terminal domain-containing protein n=1 Tax=Jatrophihabitans sp. TaxID=1932789 RepID=UPI0030C66E6B
MCEATLNAVADAGLSVDDIDGFSFYHNGFDAGRLSSVLGIPELRWSSVVSGGGGGSQGAIANAAAAVAAGYADVVLCVKALKATGPGGRRIGRPRLRDQREPAGGPDLDFNYPFGLMSPGQSFAMMARRHMHQYGTTTRQFGEVAVTTRLHASRNPAALHRTPITLADHDASRVIADPLRLLDFCLETEGGTALIVTSAERARSLRQTPVHIRAAAQGGSGAWGQGIYTHQMPGDEYTSSGHRPLAARLYSAAGLGPEDIDVAEMYDHFSPLVIMQLEDYGFCAVGEGGPFVEDGGTRWDTGRLPVNTHGGNLSEVYLLGFTHTIEAVRQLRGTSTSQVQDAEVALVTSGPGVNPTSALILRR